MAQRQLLKRDEGLEICELPGNEMLVYDSRHRVTHFLNSTTVLIWKKCDGNIDRLELERIVQSELNVSKARLTVRAALNELSKFNLLL